MTAPVVHPYHSDAWHAERHGIGGSEAATVAGVEGARGSRFALWLEKTGQLPPDHVEQTEQMAMGVRMERVLAEMFEEQTGLFVGCQQLMVRHPEHDWARATLDGAAFEGPRAWTLDPLAPVPDDLLLDAVGVVEWKLDGFSRPYDPDDIPADKQVQVQWQLAVTGLERGWLGVLHTAWQFRVYELVRDEALIEALLEACGDFWHNHVVPQVPPMLDGFGRDDTARALAAVYGKGGGGEVDLTPMAEKVAALRLLKAEAKALDEQIVDLSNEVKAALKDADVGLIDGRPLVGWKKSKGRREFDREWHAVWAPDCHETFMATGEGERRLTLREPCPFCDRDLRAQDVAKHMKKAHPECDEQFTTEAPMRRLLIKGDG